MKIEVCKITPVKLSTLNLGECFIENFDTNRVFQRITLPEYLHEYLGIDPKQLNNLVCYCELTCGWTYFYTKDEAENKDVYKVIPATGSLQFKHEDE